MAVAPQLNSPLVAYTNADWNEQPFRFWVGNAQTADNFTGYTFDGALTPRAGGPDTLLSSAAGTLIVTQPNMVQVLVPQATMAALSPGSYDFWLRKTSAGGATTIILTGVLTLIAKG